MPFLSVVIPTYHRNDLLALCLDTLAPGAQTIDSEQYEVIVTDDGSVRSAKEMILEKYPWAKWVEGPRKGPAANRNNGARQAQSDWLVFTDDDCLPTKNWLEVYQKAIEKSSTQHVFEGAIHCTDEKELAENEFAECPVNKTGNNFWSANIAVKKELLWQAGGFDEGYFLAAQEDQQLKIDLEKLSPITFLPDSIVYHPVRYGDWVGAIKKIPKQSKNFGRFAAKNNGVLGYSNLVSFYKEQIIFHGYHFVKNLKIFHFKQALVSSAWLLFGVHSNAFYFKKFRK